MSSYLIACRKLIMLSFIQSRTTGTSLNSSPFLDAYSSGQSETAIVGYMQKDAFILSILVRKPSGLRFIGDQAASSPVTLISSM